MSSFQSSPPKEKERRSSSHAEPEDKKRKRQGSNAEEKVDDFGEKEEAEKEEAEKMAQNEIVQKLSDRVVLEHDQIKTILNQSLQAQPSDFETKEVTKRVFEVILRNVQYLNDPPSSVSITSEVIDFRHLMALAAQLDEQDWMKHHPKKEVSHGFCSTLCPKYIAAPRTEAKQSPSHINATAIYSAGNIHVECELMVYKSANTAIDQVLKAVADHGPLAPLKPGERYILKVVGKKDYLWGEDQLIDFSYIRKHALASLPVKVSLYAAGKSDIDETQPIKYTFRDVLALRSKGNKKGNLHQQSTFHEDLNMDAPGSHLHKDLSLWDVNIQTELTINSLSNMSLTPELVKSQKLKESDEICVSVVAQIFHGADQLAPAMCTPWRALRDAIPAPGLESYHNTVWGQTHGTLKFSTLLSHLPRDARLCLTVVACVDKMTATKAHREYDAAAKLVDENKQTRQGLERVKSLLGVSKEDEEESPFFYLGWVNTQLFDHLGCLRTGPRSLKMWGTNEKANPIGVVSNPITAGGERDKHLCLNFSTPKFARIVRFPKGDVPERMKEVLANRHRQHMNELEPNLHKNVVNQLRQVRSVIHEDPLYRLTAVDKILLWQFRTDLTENPSALSKFLQAVDWASPAAVQEALKLIGENGWRQPPEGEELLALELLDSRYANAEVREYAITILDKLPDALLAECILQLVQVLKYEPYHYSALARFLLKRSVGNPYQIGHAVFWHLKAEVTNPAVAERHGLLIEEFLKRVPVAIHRSFEKQDALIELLLGIGINVKKPIYKPKDRNTFIRTELDNQLQKHLSNAKFTLPLDPRMECCGLRVEKCKVMDSKKLPLWLVFRNSDPLGEPVYVMFKAGDDLRQDLLTLQMISMMDSMWKAQGLDLNMSPYGCVACGDGVGMIEIVLNSETIANITKKSGGPSMAFKEDPMINWLRQQSCNKTPDGVTKCMWNFLYSCSGYCVATYILGIGDRHADNIMMKKDGTLFHIDFGHFLGNFKKKFMIKRETSPFVFTPMYAFVLGGEKSAVYKHFVDVACTAYNIVRRSSHIIISLFALMLSTGIPELQKPDDIEWLQNVLLVGDDAADDALAARIYEEKIRDSLNNKRILVNDYIHMRVRV